MHTFTEKTKNKTKTLLDKVRITVRKIRVQVYTQIALDVVTQIYDSVISIHLVDWSIGYSACNPNYII